MCEIISAVKKAFEFNREINAKTDRGLALLAGFKAGLVMATASTEITKQEAVEIEENPLRVLIIKGVLNKNQKEILEVLTETMGTEKIRFGTNLQWAVIAACSEFMKAGKYSEIMSTVVKLHELRS